MTSSLYDWLLFLHIVAAMVWVGGVTILGALAIRVLRERDPGGIARFVRSLRAIGPVVLAPAPAAVLAFGIWLTADDAAWSFGQLWVGLALGLMGAAFLIGAAHQSWAAIAAERAAARGDHREAARRLVRWAWGMAAIAALLVATTWDMVLKPGLS